MIRCARGVLVGIGMFAASGCYGALVVEEDDAGAADGASSRQRWTGNEDNCPAGMPADETPCAVAEGQSCLYSIVANSLDDYETQFDCQCWEQSAGRTAWLCHELGFGTQCLGDEPVHGSDCFGDLGTYCDYPGGASCSCSEETGATWACVYPERRSDTLHAPGTDPEKPISEMTSEERAAWCDWYVSVENGAGYPEPQEREVEEDGYIEAYGCVMNEKFLCAGGAPKVSRAECAANLALSSCSAPLSELDDCALTILDGCMPVTHGCARYLENPECEGTMIIAAENFVPGSDPLHRPACRLRVE